MTTATAKATRMQLALGFLCIYLVWGSTYFAIRVAVATIPPFVLGGVRFLVAGSALYAWARLRGAAAPNREEWKNAGIVGAALLLVGNGAVVWSEQRVSSGMAALLVATVPVWLVIAELWQRRRPSALQWFGVAAGLVGVALLVLPTGGSSAGAISVSGAIVLTIGTLSWTFGSLFARTARLAKPASLASGMQMLWGGVLMLGAAAASGELGTLHPRDVTGASALGLLYLIVFGSIIGFSTYMWLLTVASPAAVGTYAYINPLVAVLLGVVLGGETMPPRAFLAMFVIVGSVALVSLAPYLRRRNVQVA